jgi:hypothetical protein
MANNSDNGGLYFIVGALVVAVAFIGYLYANGSLGARDGSAPTIAIHKTEVNPPAEAPVKFDLNIDNDRDGRGRR